VSHFWLPPLQSRPNWLPSCFHKAHNRSEKRANPNLELANRPLLKNEWVEMGDPAPLRRRTHGGAGAGALALVKPLPPKAVAGRPGFTRASVPATIATGGPMGCSSRPCAHAKPLARRYIIHSKFKRAANPNLDLKVLGADTHAIREMSNQTTTQIAAAHRAQLTSRVLSLGGFRNVTEGCGTRLRC
jgi:hypothetical protein